MQTRPDIARFVNSFEQPASELQAASLRGDSLTKQPDRCVSAPVRLHHHLFKPNVCLVLK